MSLAHASSETTPPKLTLQSLLLELSEEIASAYHGAFDGAFLVSLFLIIVRLPHLSCDK